MGLDMYLNKAKRIGDATVQDIYDAENYLCWKNTTYIKKNGKKPSLKEWCGLTRKPKFVDKYRKEYKMRYWNFDVNKEYGHEHIWEEMASWRKANQIHNWFVQNVQGGIDDCGSYEVTKEQLLTLLELCKEVKKHSKLVKGKVINGYHTIDGKWVPNFEDGEYIADSTVAEELLPRTSGFFFGSTDYDQWYMQDIEYTINILEKILEETDFEKEIVIYGSSW